MISIISSKLGALFFPIFFIARVTCFTFIFRGHSITNSSLLSSSLNCSLIHKAFILLISILSLVIGTSFHSIYPSYACFQHSASAIGPEIMFNMNYLLLYLEKVCKHLCQFLGSSWISGFLTLLLKYSSANFLKDALVFSLVHSSNSSFSF